MELNHILAPRRPLVYPGENSPRQSPRIGPVESLDFRAIEAGMTSNVLAILGIGDQYNDHGSIYHRHAVINVLAPYVPNGWHVMTLNTGRAYTPSPHSLPHDVGSGLASAWVSILDWMRNHGADTTWIGYNWSPWGFGVPEALLGGGQSIPTRFHVHLVGERAEPREPVDPAQLTLSQRRLFTGGKYARPLADLIYQRAFREPEGSFFRTMFPDVQFYEMGLSLKAEYSLIEIVGHEQFFPSLATLSIAIEKFFQDLTECLTNLDCEGITRLLKETENRKVRVADLDTPLKMRDRVSVKLALAQAQIPDNLIDTLYEPVRKRCSLDADALRSPLTDEECAELQDMWRKGFAYSFVLRSTGATTCELLIAPWVYLGPCGIVEAQMTLLTRPKEQAPIQELMEMTKELMTLATAL